MSQATDVAPSAAVRRRGEGLGKDFAARYGVIVAMLVTIVVFSLLKPDAFATLDNVKSMLQTVAPVLVVACGVTVVLAMHEFDLSVVGAVGLGSGVVVTLIAEQGMPVAAAIVVGLLLGVVIGLVNGALSAGLGASTFIITLAVGQVLTGVEFRVTDEDTIYQGIPASYTEIASGKLFGFSNSVFIALGVFVVLYALMAQTQVGRYIYAIGGNREAARFSGVPVKRYLTLGLVITGVCSVIAGVLLSSAANAYTHELAVPFLLPPYAAAFLGSAVLRPGTFNLPGTLVGALFLEIISTGLATLALSSSIVLIVQGAILVAAVLLSITQRRRA